MLTQEGDNTCVIGVDGNFDDTQTGVKQIFSNQALRDELSEAGYNFSSANSINIGRLLPQVVYYFYSYFELVKSGEIAQGDKVNFVVPTGNFGNILAGYYAKILGLPVNRFICASKSNNVLTDFFSTGKYNRKRDFYKTISPSMDILISSNLERLIFDLSGGDTAFVARLMESLNTDGNYTIPDEMIEKAQSLFYGGYADEIATEIAIHDMFVDHHYLMDPHTAVASKVYDDYLAETGDTTPAIILSTASPYKFGHSVYKSIFGDIPDGMDDYEVLKALSEKTGTAVPEPLKDLDKKPNRHSGTCAVDEMPSTVKDFVLKREAAR